MPNTKSRACDSCYKRKIRCDASEKGGVCEWCQEHDFACTFARKKQRSGPKKSTQSRLKSRINTLGDFVASAYTPSTDSNKPVSTSSTPGPKSASTSICPTCRPRLSVNSNGQTLGQIFVFGQNFGVMCARYGLPHLTTSCEEWVFSKTGQWPHFYDFCKDPPATYKRVYTESPLSSPYAEPRAELPPIETVKSLFKEYVNSDYGMVFPLVDRILFEETIQLAYDPNADQESDAYISSKACVFAFVCIACTHYSPEIETPGVNADRCVKEAQQLFTETMEDTSLVAVQTCFMFVLYECLCGHLQASSKYHSIAVRLTFALGGHTVSYPRPKHRQLTMREREDRQLRLLFWLGYCFDKEIAIRTGQPPIMPDDYCDLTLPDGYLESHFALQHEGGIIDDMQTPCLIGDLRLDLIKAKAIRNLYSASASKMTDAEMIRTIRELDEDLENWRLSIPDKFAPALSLPKDIEISEELNQGRSMLHIELHLDYLHILNTIHWASGRCLVSSQEGLSFGVNSSLELTIEASRSIIIYMSSAAHRLVGEAFWIFIFYPINALICLFITILSHPTSDTALQDLLLLRKTSEIMRSMPIRRLTSHEIEYLGRVDVFVGELSRLAECAIQQAS